MKRSRGTGILIAILTLFNRGLSANSDWIPAPGRNLTVYIGVPLAHPTAWRKAKTYNREQVVLEDGTVLRPAEARSHLIVYPNNEVLTGANVFDPLPPGVKFLTVPPGSGVTTSLNAAQIAHGNTVCFVQHGAARRNAEGHTTYSTTLRNLSQQRIRIERFAGFKRVGDRYVHTATDGFYNAEQFITWYSTAPDGWIPVKGTATDLDNWSSGDVIWAFFGIMEDGRTFVATAPAPK